MRGPAGAYEMNIAILQITLHIPKAQSLKEKRSVIRHIQDRIRNGMNVSVAEVGHQDKWQLCDLGFVTVAADAATARKRMEAVRSVLDGLPHVSVTDADVQVL